MTDGWITCQAANFRGNTIYDRFMTTVSAKVEKGILGVSLSSSPICVRMLKIAPSVTLTNCVDTNSR